MGIVTSMHLIDQVVHCKRDVVELVHSSCGAKQHTRGEDASAENMLITRQPR